MLNLGSGNLRSVSRHGSSKHGQIAASNSEASLVSNILDSLDNTLGVDILVLTGHSTVSCLCLLSYGVEVIVAERVLASLVLGMVLAAGDSRDSGRLNNRHSGSLDNRSSMNNWGSSSLNNWGSGSLNNWGSGSMNNWGSSSMNNLGSSSLNNWGSSSCMDYRCSSCVIAVV